MHALKKKAEAADASTITMANTIADKREESSARFRSSLSPEQIREVLSRRQRIWEQRLIAAKKKKKPVVPQVTLEMLLLYSLHRSPTEVRSSPLD